MWAAGLLPTLLQHTHLDEENPCLREWASFTISNMMLLPQVQVSSFLLPASPLAPEGLAWECELGVALQILTEGKGVTCLVNNDISW